MQQSRENTEILSQQLKLKIIICVLFFFLLCPWFTEKFCGVNLDELKADTSQSNNWTTCSLTVNTQRTYIQWKRFSPWWHTHTHFHTHRLYTHIRAHMLNFRPNKYLNLLFISYKICYLFTKLKINQPHSHCSPQSNATDSIRTVIPTETEHKRIVNTEYHI